MPARKVIRDEGEVIRWIEEGRTYAWMVEEYERRYHEKVTANMFSSFRRRPGLSRRIQRDVTLIPWAVKAEHGNAFPLAMLRAEARRRGGFPLRDQDQRRLESWKDRLAEDGVVVHYDPDTPQGWWLVPRRPGVDLDLIHEPERPTAIRGVADERD